ncbi:MAG TPA: hypothetical protein PKI89_06815 [Tepidiformaceae bacterium]|nr:hypothetical protein [Tepidiformaceae bacterium]HNO65337.1 hypothetical protein [Tepidiformaceae bacterium]
MKALLIAALIALPLFAACGGGDDGGGGKKTNAASTAAMAQGFVAELTKMKQCIQDEVDGKSQCGGNLISADPVSNLCNDVHTGRTNQYAGADYTRFQATCEAWSDVLGSPIKERNAKIDQMITDLGAIK